MSMPRHANVDQWTDLAHRDDWITTYSGGPFFPLNPRSEDVRIADIAHALSLLCRFAGHTRQFYSVAQHSVIVSHLCDPTEALWGLLHDASEAYLSDIVRPLKQQPDLDGYRRVEACVQAAVCRRFGLSIDEPPLVKEADRIVLRSEQRDLMTMPIWWQPGHTVPFEIRPMHPAHAEVAFLLRFHELYQEPVR